MCIASKTGWSESFIRWELPMNRGNAYYHMSRALEGERCRWPGEGQKLVKWAQAVRVWAQKMTRRS